MFYSIALFSTKHRHESTISLPISPSTWTSLPPPPPSHLSRLLLNPGLSSLSYTANCQWLSILPMAMLFPCYSLHASHLLLVSPAAMSVILFSMSVYPLLLSNRFISTICFFRFHIYVLVFAIARTWKWPRCPSTDEWMKKLWCIYTMEYYSAIRRNAFESVLMRWMNLDPIIQSDVSAF